MSQRRKTAPAARPLTARSVLASVLLGSEPPWLPTPLLLRTTALFGISDGSTRTALSRMARSGEVVAEGGGYRLAGRLVERQERQTASRQATVRSWDGGWELATVDGDEARAAADRAALREALSALRLAELREGVWARPDNLDAGRAPAAAVVVARWCHRWQGAQPQASPDVGDLWDLDAWATAAGELRADMAALADRLGVGDTSVLADGFVTSAAVLRHLQADPLLPAELLPRRWPGPALREDYDRYDAAYRAVLRDWFTAA